MSAHKINQIVQAVIEEFNIQAYAPLLKPYINALYQNPAVADRLYKRICEVVKNVR